MNVIVRVAATYDVMVVPSTTQARMHLLRLGENGDAIELMMERETLVTVRDAIASYLNAPADEPRIDAP